MVQLINMGEEVLLQRFNSNSRAETAQNLLKKAGIKSAIKVEGGADFRGVLRDGQEVDLWVSKKDLQRAQVIIENLTPQNRFFTKGFIIKIIILALIIGAFFWNDSWILKTFKLAPALKSSPTPIPTEAPKAPKIKVLSPKEGDNWEKGKTYEIKWDASALDDSDTVTLGLYKGRDCSFSPITNDSVCGAGYSFSVNPPTAIAINVPKNQGSFNWIVPTFIPAGDDYKIDVGDSNYLPYAIQGDFFSIVDNPSLKLYTLEVFINSPMESIVYSDPVGIDCMKGKFYPIQCSATFAPGTKVILFALENDIDPMSPTTIFSSWSGDCSGANLSCAIIMDSDKSTTANFEKL